MSKNRHSDNVADASRPQHAAIMVFDVKGYSKLREWSFDLFFQLLVPEVNRLLGSPRYKNSWGDGFIAVYNDIESTVTAAKHAMEILRLFKFGNVNIKLNNVSDLSVRVALHFGQLYFGTDLIRGGTGCCGEAINTCARIEPIVDPANNAWCSEIFARTLDEQTKNSSKQVGYYELGTFLLPKGAGSQRLYELVDKSNRVDLQEASVNLGPHPKGLRGTEASSSQLPERIVDLTTAQLLTEVRQTVTRCVNDLEINLNSHLAAADSGTFGERSSHFREEKRAIARQWFSGFRKSIEDKTQTMNERKVRLFLDSGTTVYEVFPQILREQNWKLFTERNIEVITNNVPGLKLLMDDKQLLAGVGPSVEATAFYDRVRMLPGSPLPRYRAIVSDETIDYLGNNYTRDDSHFNIVVTTGNYVKFDGSAIYARDTHHRRFKSTLMKLADEVWLLAPLGKIVPENWDAARLNRFFPPTQSPSDQYELVEIPDYVQHTIMCSARTPGDKLYNHFQKVRIAVTDRCERQLQVKLCLVPTDGPDGFAIKEVAGNTGVSQELLEFPHNWMRDPANRQRIFADFGVV